MSLIRESLNVTKYRSVLGPSTNESRQTLVRKKLKGTLMQIENLPISLSSY